MSSPSILYAFATPMELSSVFPECENSVESGVSDKLVALPRGLGYACILGIGMLDFSVNLSSVLVQSERSGLRFSSVIILGVCGAYVGRGVDILDVVRVDSEMVGDMGYQEKDGSFYPIPGSVMATSPEKASESIRRLRSVAGLTVNCCTGTEELGLQRARMFNADIENMEGAAGMAVCRSFGIPVFEVRAVCNMASTRDRASWKLHEALAALRKCVMCGE